MSELERSPSIQKCSALQKIRCIARASPESVEACIRELQIFHVIAGVDEVGRGPLAGPVVACACVLPEKVSVPHVVDSKKLSEAQIIDTYHRLVNLPGILFATARIEPEVIDKVNILQATLLAMQQAVRSLKAIADLVLIDGNIAPCLPMPTVPVVKGDQHCVVISAASIIAKYIRDEIMREYDKQYPGYGFAQHKGYGTALHVQMLQLYGVSPIHRKTFEPVSKVLC
jgi:ribonuclease HII